MKWGPQAKGDWERDFPGRTETIFSALRNVELGHLADTRNFDFVGLDDRRVPPAAAGFMSASDEAELDDRLESLAISA